MKHIHLLLIFLTITTFSSQAQEINRYAVKSGYLKLELTGNTTGTKELWWDNYGDKTCELEKSSTTTKIFGMKNTEKKHMLTILIKDKYWVLDYLKNTGTKGTAQGYQSSHDLANSMTEEEQQQLADDILAGFGGEKLPSEKVGNYQCDVFQVLGTKTWFYKGIPIKTDGKLMGIVTKEMYTEFNPGAQVPASKFRAPETVNYENMDEMAASLWGTMDEDEDEEEEQIVPLMYPYSKFQKVINGFSYPGFTCRGINNVDGRYATSFTKGISNAIMIIAQSDENSDTEANDSFEHLTIGGHKCHYGVIEEEEEESTALIMEYPEHSMIIVIVGVPPLEKSQLIAIAEKLKF